VHVHTDVASVVQAEALNAAAFTVGQDIHFASGRYDRDSAAGERLLAHEVAHAAQQMDASLEADLSMSARGDRYEVDAGRAADALLPERPASVVAAPAMIAREESGSELVQTSPGQVAENRHGTIKEIDEMRARIVDAFGSTVLSLGNRDLIREA